MHLTPDKHFSYCLNVHPGETLEDIHKVLQTDVPAIKQALSPDAPFGLGLRLARQAAHDLHLHRERERLQEAIHQAGAYVFTINGFPYGAFHQTRVKENVYLPDWSHPDRLTYTLDLFAELAELLPSGVQGSVSTVPLGYKFSRCKMEDTLTPLKEVARTLHELEQKTGHTLHLGLEPEPDCLLETTAETLDFFENHLFKGSGKEEPLLRKHLGVCLDTCHVAMQFEDPAESLRTYRAAGICLSKVQLSAAVECPSGIDPKTLTPFDDGVYLHQVVCDNGQRRRDLPDWITNPTPEGHTLRIHAHVPLHWAGRESIRSTRHTLTQDFWQELSRDSCPHIEVETYTFDVLPPSVRGNQSLSEDMVAECRWALENFPS